jgi:hypothetical protein
MTFAALLTELKRLRIRVSVNGATGSPALMVEPKERVTPELEAALRAHKDALVQHITAGPGSASIFTDVRAVLEALPTPVSVDQLDEPLRRLAVWLSDCDALTRQLLRTEIVAGLEQRALRSPAKIVDAALAGMTLPQADDPHGGRRLLLEDVTPWPTPVEGPQLLEELRVTFAKYIVLPVSAAETLALWTLYTHAAAAFDLSPYLVLSSPEPRCGKTTTLALLAALVPRPLPASKHVSKSPLGISRMIEVR